MQSWHLLIKAGELLWRLQAGVLWQHNKRGDFDDLFNPFTADMFS